MERSHEGIIFEISLPEGGFISEAKITAFSSDDKTARIGPGGPVRLYAEVMGLVDDVAFTRNYIKDEDMIRD